MFKEMKRKRAAKKRRKLEQRPHSKSKYSTMGSFLLPGAALGVNALHQGVRQVSGYASTRGPITKMRAFSGYGKLATAGMIGGYGLAGGMNLAHRHRRRKEVAARKMARRA